MPKTVIIWDQFGETPLSYVVVNGDQRHFDRVYVNEYTNVPEREVLIDKLFAFMYDEKTGKMLHEQLIDFPHHEVARNHAYVITAGWIP